MIRRDDNRWTRRLTVETKIWNIGRCRGRQKRRWNDDITSYIVNSRTGMAKIEDGGKIMKRATSNIELTEPG